MTVATPPLLVAGIGEMVVTKEQGVNLVAYGLGSCVALSAWDPHSKVAGLAHFMLPAGPPGGPPVKFVESGIGTFLETFAKQGGSPSRAEFKAAGGAAMLSVMSGNLEIGKRNAEAVVSALHASGLKLAAADLGGKAGRTVQLEATSGRLLVKSVATVSVL